LDGPLPNYGIEQWRMVVIVTGDTLTTKRPKEMFMILWKKICAKVAQKLSGQV